MWRHAVYPALLLVSLTGLIVIDRSYALAFWHDARRAAITLVVAVAFFGLWDICGIGLNIFYAADATYRSGLMLGPSFPVEEVLFLSLFGYTILIAWTYMSTRQ